MHIEAPIKHKFLGEDPWITAPLREGVDISTMVLLNCDYYIPITDTT